MTISFSSLAEEKRVVLSLDEAFIEAIELRNKGRFTESDIIFDLIIEANKDPILMLEIGRIYFEERRYNESKNVFKQIKKSFNLPNTTIEKLNFFISQSEVYSGKISYDVSLISTKNPNRNPNSGVYVVLGTPLVYQNNEDKRYYGVKHKLNYTTLLGDNWLSTVSSELKDFESSEADTNTLYFSVNNSLAPSIFFTDINATFEDGFGYKRSSFGLKFGVETFIANTPIISSIGYAQLENTSSKLYEGGQFQFLFSLLNPFKIENSKIDIFKQRESLNDDVYSNTYSSLQLSKTLQLDSIDIQPSILFSETKFSTFDIFWNKTRKDKSIKPHIDICLKKFQKIIERDICITFSNESRKSNISFYNYNENSTEFSIKSTF